MKQVLGLAVLTDILFLGGILADAVSAQTKSSLYIAYPPPEHQTTAEKIFFIGTASPNGEVTINGESVELSRAGHFAPSFPLKMGKNVFKIRHQDEELTLEITRNSTKLEIPEELGFVKNSLTPGVDIARLPEELICFGAVAPPNAEVSVRIGTSKILLLPQVEMVALPPNSAVLTAENQPINQTKVGQYQGCTTLEVSRNFGQPIFELQKDGEVVRQKSTGMIEILSQKDIQVVEVIAHAGVARTGASTDYSRLTPLPKGTRARVTGKEGEWLRLDYGGWIKESETQPVAGNIPPLSIIRGITSRQIPETSDSPGSTEIIFPLQVPVPLAIKQGDNQLTLSLYNTTAQTDTIHLDPDPTIKRLDWQQVTPNQIDYTFQLHNKQQWGYDLRYEGTNLILSLRHPPQAYSPKNNFNNYRDNSTINQDINIDRTSSLTNIKILLDPGHGGKETGSKGPTGYPEKEINLLISQLVKTELEKLGATVYLTREKDEDVSLEDRVRAIDKIKPNLAISIHYNALPDSGDAINTQGISTFWYHTQAHDVATFLHNYLVEKLNRSSYGTFWNNLALTRPHAAPAILLELGFMINPQEFEWITNSNEQKRLAAAIAQGIQEWFSH
jgi:N-acetylmuramoyl-L-alanine amidase